MCAASMSVPPTATATAPSQTLPPLRSTFELLIDAAGELDSRPPPHVSVQHPSMQYARTAVARPLPPHISSLSSSTGMAAARQSFFDASHAPLRNMPQLPSMRMAPGGHLPHLPPLVSDFANQQSSQDAQPRTASPSSSGAIPLPPPLPHHAPRNIAPKPHTRLACRILPRATAAACAQPTVSVPVPVAPAPAPVHGAATAAAVATVGISRPRGGIVKPGTNSAASGSPASSTASLAAAAATVMGSVDAVQNAQSEVEKRQLVRKMRNREAAARSNQKRKIRHDKLKSELSDVKNRVATLRDKERLLMEENGRLKHLTS